MLVIIVGYSYTVFIWLNTAATITHVVKLDVATIQGRLATIRGRCLLH